MGEEGVHGEGGVVCDGETLLMLIGLIAGFVGLEDEGVSIEGTDRGIWFFAFGVSV